MFGVWKKSFVCCLDFRAIVAQFSTLGEHSMKLLPLIFLLILTGCDTAQPDFHDASATIAQDRPWLQPIAQANQSIATKEGRIYIQADNESTSVDLECGIYLDEHNTCVVYKIRNGHYLKSIVAMLKIKDAKGNELILTKKNPTQQTGFTAKYWEIPGQTIVIGNEPFTGFPSAYPVTVSWQYMEGKIVTFIFDAPKQ
jgi:hypothetical protein